MTTIDTTKGLTLGTLLRHLTELLDGAVEAAYARSGLDYRPRYTPVVRALAALGPSSIRTISRQASITHSAVSQTVAQMAKQRLVSLRATSDDGRERIVTLTARAQSMLPALERQWAATNAAALALDEELSAPLSELLRETLAALERQPFGERIDQAAAPHTATRTSGKDGSRRTGGKDSPVQTRGKGSPRRSGDKDGSRRASAKRCDVRL